MNVLLAPYFWRGVDPQRRRRYRPDDDRLLARWLPGVRRLRLEARVFHDGLSPAFVAARETARVRFVTAKVPRRVSCNDERFIIYLDWLRAHPEVHSVFCTDLFDVAVHNDPHALCSGSTRLWVGREPWRIEERESMRMRLLRAYGSVDPALAGKPILNAGIFGGSRAIVLRLLEAVSEEILRVRALGPAGFNCNMAAFNRVLYERFTSDEVWAEGRPLHSVFQRYEPGARDVCFVHR